MSVVSFRYNTLNETASDLPRLLKQNGKTHADVILSGLPWASFPNGLQDEILNAILASLPEGGSFATFAYLQGILLPAVCICQIPSIFLLQTANHHNNTVCGKFKCFQKIFLKTAHL